MSTGEASTRKRCSKRSTTPKGDRHVHDGNEARGETRFLGSEQGSALLGELGARPANTLLPLDPGGVDRRFEYEIGHLKSFAVAGAEIIEGSR